MKAIVIHQYGDPDVLQLEDLPVPEAAAGQVRVRVRAISINPVDYKRRRNWTAQPLPVVLGWDVSGVIDAVGPEVDDFKAGDEVYGMVWFPEQGRAYAEYVIAPVTDIALKPAGLSHNEAAAMTLAPLTAHQAFETMGLTHGQTVLIHAGAGGVGHFAVQLAKARGARVVATASGANLEFVAGLGADEVIDYRARPFEEQVQEVDAVLDTVGGDTTDRSIGVLRRGGVLITIAGKPDAELAQRHGVRAEHLLVHPSRADLEFLSAQVEAGRLHPHVGQTFPLERMADAHRAQETGRTVGKIVVEVG